MKGLLRTIGFYIGLRAVRGINKDLAGSVFAALGGLTGMITATVWFFGSYYVKADRIKTVKVYDSEGYAMAMPKIVEYYGYPEGTLAEFFFYWVVVAVVVHFVVMVTLFILAATVFSKYFIPEGYDNPDSMPDFVHDNVFHHADGTTRDKKGNIIKGYDK